MSSSLTAGTSRQKPPYASARRMWRKSWVCLCSQSSSRRGFCSCKNYERHIVWITKICILQVLGAAHCSQYFSQFSFIDPVTFKVGSCFTIWGKSICWFEVGFVHEKIPGEAKLFAIVSDIKECRTEDLVLQLPQMRVVYNSQGIVGLPGIRSKPVFIVSIDPERKQVAS
ncbi:hypothetical protein VC83_03316 [Pseudogymnoascus destructans]|uniref:Uncharacterized protein n=1 Tax=Pseudogymnoascus destructans TaxID=655981 RepID=A0A177AF54_9PEZI|nr:uncharacterized protein VC83_03316 [Pseudogymnoascus destructans]OAF60746.1 hypothetical protein VC83_03316 [Pseudogymnoascus destructans]